MTGSACLPRIAMRLAGRGKRRAGRWLASGADERRVADADDGARGGDRWRGGRRQALYHLAKRGWTNSVLLERTELTAGSTWHAAGLLPLFNMSYSVGQLHQYSVELYQKLEAETGQDVSVPADRQFAAGHQPRPDGRVPQLPVHRRDDRRRVPPDRRRRDPQALAARQHGRAGRRAVASDRRAHRPGRPHHGAGQGLPGRWGPRSTSTRR